MMEISDFINKQNKFKVDYNYQRRAGAWTNQDNQCFIDTILRGDPIPMFFFNTVVDKDGELIFYIVDGQQRLDCIRRFYNNEFKLSSKFSDEELDGCTFSGNKPLPEKYQDAFLKYKLSVWELNNCGDEKIRTIFSRLQRGKPLNLGERLNALPGTIVNTMRELSKHEFINDTVCINRNRYNVFPIVAKMMFYEIYGTKECSNEYLFKFFDEYKDEPIKGKIYNMVLSNLNYLSRCFKSGGKYFCLERDARIITIYTMVSYLNKYKAMSGHEADLRKFAIGFFNKAYDEGFRNSNPTYNKFHDMCRGGWSEALMTQRQNIIIDEFLKEYEILDLDYNRQISNAQKSILFEKHPYCERCKKTFSFYNEPEYHHIIRYADGGKRENNIEILCKECHDIIHGKRIYDINIDEELDKEYEE